MIENKIVSGTNTDCLSLGQFRQMVKQKGFKVLLNSDKDNHRKSIKLTMIKDFVYYQKKGSDDIETDEKELENIKLLEQQRLGINLQVIKKNEQDLNQSWQDISDESDDDQDEKYTWYDNRPIANKNKLIYSGCTCDLRGYRDNDEYHGVNNFEKIINGCIKHHEIGLLINFLISQKNDPKVLYYFITESQIELAIDTSKIDDNIIKIPQKCYPLLNLKDLQDVQLIVNDQEQQLNITKKTAKILQTMQLDVLKNIMRNEKNPQVQLKVNDKLSKKEFTINENLNFNVLHCPQKIGKKYIVSSLIANTSVSDVPEGFHKCTLIVCDKSKISIWKKTLKKCGVRNTVVLSTNEELDDYVKYFENDYGALIVSKRFFEEFEENAFSEYKQSRVNKYDTMSFNRMCEQFDKCNDVYQQLINDERSIWFFKGVHRYVQDDCNMDQVSPYFFDVNSYRRLLVTRFEVSTNQLPFLVRLRYCTGPLYNKLQERFLHHIDICHSLQTTEIQYNDKIFNNISYKIHLLPLEDVQQRYNALLQHQMYVNFMDSQNNDLKNHLNYQNTITRSKDRSKHIETLKKILSKEEIHCSSCKQVLKHIFFDEFTIYCPKCFYNHYNWRNGNLVNIYKNHQREFYHVSLDKFNMIEATRHGDLYQIINKCAEHAVNDQKVLIMTDHKSIFKHILTNAGLSCKTPKVINKKVITDNQVIIQNPQQWSLQDDYTSFDFIYMVDISQHTIEYIENRLTDFHKRENKIEIINVTMRGSQYNCCSHSDFKTIRCPCLRWYGRDYYEDCHDNEPYDEHHYYGYNPYDNLYESPEGTEGSEGFDDEF